MHKVERARWAVTAMFFINGSVFGTWAAHIPLVKDRLALSPEVLGTALLCLAAGALLAMMAAGTLAARVSSATLIRVTGALFCLFLPLPSVVPGTAALMAVLFLLGAAGGTMDVAMNTHGAQVETMLKRPVMSSLHGMWSLGGLIGAGAGGLLFTVLAPVVQAMAVAGALSTLLLLAQTWLLPGGEARVNTETGPGLPWWPGRGTLLLGGLTLLAFMSEGAILDWSAVYLRDDLRGAAEIAGLGFAAFSGTMAVGRFLGDGLRRRFGGVVLLRTGAFLAAIGLGGALSAPQAGLAIAGFAVAGLGLSNIVPVLLSAAGHGSEAEAARAIATVATLGYTGVLIGPALFGYVAGMASVTAAFALVAGLCATVGLVAQGTRRWVGGP